MTVLGRTSQIQIFVDLYNIGSDYRCVKKRQHVYYLNRKMIMFVYIYVHDPQCSALFTQNKCVVVSMVVRGFSLHT